MLLVWTQASHHVSLHPRCMTLTKHWKRKHEISWASSQQFPWKFKRFFGAYEKLCKTSVIPLAWEFNLRTSTWHGIQSHDTIALVGCSGSEAMLHLPLSSAHIVQTSERRELSCVYRLPCDLGTMSNWGSTSCRILYLQQLPPHFRHLCWMWRYLIQCSLASCLQIPFNREWNAWKIGLASLKTEGLEEAPLQLWRHTLQLHYDPQKCDFVRTR